jgi:DNA modification methylase
VTATVVHGDARELASTIPCEACITSPPFFSMRRYSDDAREIGLESDAVAYVDTLADVLARVNCAGYLAVEVRDKYVDGSLAGIPWLLAERLKTRGWRFRNALCWHRSNALPESARDRLTQSWNPVLLLTKAKRPYFAPDPEPAKWERWGAQTASAAPAGVNGRWHANTEKVRELQQRRTRHARDLLSIPSNRSAIPGHYAVMPLELARWLVRATTPPGGTVLDPFSGAGTTLLAASLEGRRCVGIELVQEIAEVARRRLEDAR